MYNGTKIWSEQAAFTLTTVTLGNGTTIETYPDLPANLYEAVKLHAARNPSRLALEDSAQNRFSYGDLLDTVNMFSRVLQYHYGIRKGCHVALMMYNSAEFVISFLSLLKIGAISVMLPTKYRKKEIAALVKRAELDYVISDPDYAQMFQDILDPTTKMITYPSCRDFSALTDVTDGISENCAQEGTAEDDCIMIFTSGTTSLSKGVLHTNYSFMHAAATYANLLQVAGSDSTVIAVPLYMVTGLVALLGMTLFAGGTVYLQQYFKADDVLSCVRNKNVTILHAAPSVYQFLLKEKEQFPALPGLRLLVCGGSRVPVTLIKQLYQWLPRIDLRTAYGMTECCSPATIAPADVRKSPCAESCGIPIPGLSIRIADEQGNDVPPGTMGEILLSGTNLLHEYYKLETPAYQDGWLHSGDIGYMSESGYLYVVDRIKDMINRGGEKVVSSDVEDELLQVEGVTEAAVVGISDDTYGEVPAAMVILSGTVEWTEASLQRELRKHMARYKVPEKILFTDQIPLNSNGKYDKKSIKDLL